MMIDLQLTWGGDLSLSPTGDLAVLTGAPLGTERVLRRLLTNPRDYIWNPTYGAGLAEFVGQPVDPAGIQALIQSQMFLETAVAQTPEPVIDVVSDLAGQLFAQIRYADAETASATTLNVTVPG